MAVKYTTVKKFWEFLSINESVLDFQAGNTPSRETVASTPVSAGTYYLDQLGVNEDTLTLYVGSSNTALTLTTDYTFDSDTSTITITSAGATALTGEDLTAVYEYNQLGKHLTYNETTRILEQSERRVDSECSTVFADQTATAPNYTQIVGQKVIGQGLSNTIYSTSIYPIVKLQTTVDGDYTTGAATLDVADATGFPSSGTIYIGGNKVSYTSKSTNTLTVPTSTPSISDGATVRGEVVEISTTPSGVDPTFEVLTPDADYSIDYDTGHIQLLDDFYYQTDTFLTNPQDGVFDRMRISFMQAWHEVGEDAEIPDEIEQVCYMMAGRQLVQRTVLKSSAGQRDNFTAQSFGFSKLDIDEILMRYRMTRSFNV